MAMKKVFISHSSSDKPFVRKLKRDLSMNDILTWFDEDEMFPGDSLLDKLDNGLNDSSHFIIILSPKAVESEWVEFELENALMQVEETTIEKIIPILYRKCKIPESLKNILYADLSKETVLFKNGWLEFYGNEYDGKLHEIVKSIKTSTLDLTKEEKEDLSNIKPTLGIVKDGIQIIYLKVIGFNSISKFKSTYISEEERKLISPTQFVQLQPIVLPIFLKKYFVNLKFGQEITLRGALGQETIGTFVKFSKNNNRIAIPLNIRTQLNLENKITYEVLIDTTIVGLKFTKINDR